MQADISIIKGIHPGFIVERELKSRGIQKAQFAQSLREYPQTLVAVLKGRRRMNTPLALKIEHALGFDEGYLMTLQVFHDIKEEKQRSHSQRQPELNQFRTVLFWDTAIDKIDWQRQKSAIVRRVFERGNEAERDAITRYYGKPVIDAILRSSSGRKPQPHTRNASLANGK